MNKKRKIIQETVAEVAESLTVEAAATPNNLRSRLDEIRTYEGVLGYILRNTTTAAIDLKDSTRITDFAILSSSALDALRDLVELFDLGNTRNVTVEGGDIKMLSTIIEENRISIFAEKTADCERILRKLNAY